MNSSIKTPENLINSTRTLIVGGVEVNITLEKFFWDRLEEIAATLPANPGAASTPIEFICALINESRDRLPMDEAIRRFIVKFLYEHLESPGRLPRLRENQYQDAVADSDPNDPFTAALDDITPKPKH